MKHLLLMIVLTAIGTIGAVAVNPFWGVFIYYLFAVLRPQFIWEWDLPQGVGWSGYVAYTTLAIVAATKLGMFKSAGTGETPRLGGTHYTVLAFGFWICLTYFTAVSQTQAEPFFIEYLKLFVMFWAAAQLIRRVKELWILFVMAAFTLGYIAYEVNFIYFFQGGYTYIYRRGYGGLDNNGAGLMLAMGVPLCYFSWEGMRKYWRWLFLAFIPVIIHAVMMSYSRGAMVSMIAAIPLYLLRSKRRVQMALALAAVGACIPYMAGKEIQARFFSISQNEIDESANSRRQSWAAAWQMACENPIFGLGIRNANLFSHLYGADMEGRTIHSQYLQTAADSGLVALGLYLAAFANVWLCTRRARLAVRGRTDEEARRVYSMACGVEASLLVFGIGAVFLSLESFELPYLLMLLGAQLPSVMTQGTSSGTPEYATGTTFSCERSLGSFR